MYFVTSKQAGYVLFCMTPSGRAAIGLSENQTVRLFERRPDGGWTVMKEWAPSTLSHTDIMLALGAYEEPEHPRDLVGMIPER